MAGKSIIVSRIGEGVFEEYTSITSVLTPGMICKLWDASEVAPRVTAEVAADAPPPHLVVLEDISRGYGIDDTYAIGERISLWIPRKGDIFYALLDTSQTVVMGSRMTTSDTTPGAVGTVGVSPAPDGVVLGYSLDNITTTAAVGRVRIQAI